MLLCMKQINSLNQKDWSFYQANQSTDQAQRDHITDDVEN